MLTPFIDLKKTLPQETLSQPVFQQLLAAEYSLKCQPYTEAQHHITSLALKAAYLALKDNPQADAIAYYYLFHSLELSLTNILTHKPKETHLARLLLKHAQENDPTLETHIQTVDLHLDIAQVIGDISHNPFPHLVEDMSVILTRIHTLGCEDYYNDDKDLKLTIAFLQHPDIHQLDYVPYIQKMSTIVNEKEIFKKAHLRDFYQYGQQNNNIREKITAATNFYTTSHFLECDNAFKDCLALINIQPSDPYFKIYCLMMRARCHKILYILSPETHVVRNTTSSLLFKQALALCTMPAEVDSINQTKNTLVYLSLAKKNFNHTTLTDPHKIFQLSTLLGNGGAIYSQDQHQTNDKAAQKTLLLLHSCYINLSKQEPDNYFLDFHLSSLARIMQEEESFMTHFMQFMAKLKIGERVPAYDHIFTAHAKSIYLNLLYFLKLCQKRQYIEASITEKIKEMLTADKDHHYDTLYDIASEFHSNAQIFLATLFIQIALLFEYIEGTANISKEKYINKTQTFAFSQGLWDKSLYDNLALAGNYLDLLSYAFVSSEKEHPDLSHLVQSVFPNIANIPIALLNRQQIALCEIILGSPIHLSDRKLFREIVEIYFVSKLAFYLAQKLKNDLGEFKGIEKTIKNTFPRYSACASALFKQTLVSLYPKDEVESSLMPAASLTLASTSPSAAKGKRAKKTTTHTKSLVSYKKFPALPNPSLKEFLKGRVPEYVKDLAHEALMTLDTKNQLPNASVTESYTKPAVKRYSRREATRLQAATLEPEQSTNFIPIEQPSSTLLKTAVLPIFIPLIIKRFILFLKTLGSERCSLVGGNIYTQLTLPNHQAHQHDYDIVFDLPLSTLREKAPQLFIKPFFDGNYACITYENIDIDLKFSQALADKSLDDLSAYQKDAKTRDFFSNTLIANEEGDIFDPLEVGLSHLSLNYLVPITGAKNSFLEDPFRLFRAIYLTTKREHIFSEDLLKVIPECIQELSAFFSAPENLQRINSWMYKLLCKNTKKEDGLTNFQLLENFGFIDLCFPRLIASFDAKTSYKQWFLNQLANPPKHPSLNYIYAMMMVGHLPEKPMPMSGEDSIDYLNRTLIAHTPLLQKNFESRSFSLLLHSATSHYKAFGRSHTPSIVKSMPFFASSAPASLHYRSESAPPLIDEWANDHLTPR